MQDRLHRLVHMGVGRQRRELRDHGGADRQVMRHRAQRHQMRLGGGREIDENADEDQYRIAEQAEEPECKRNPLADRRSNARGADEA